MNSVNLVGRLTRDPELREIEGGENRCVCKLRIAVDDGRGDGDRTCYVDVKTFDAAARACERYLVKGRLVAVDGRLAYSEWTTDTGSKRLHHEVIGRVQFLPDGTRGTNGNTPSEHATPVEEPVPEPVAVGADDQPDIPF